MAVRVVTVGVAVGKAAGENGPRAKSDVFQRWS